MSSGRNFKGLSTVGTLSSLVKLLTCFQDILTYVSYFSDYSLTEIKPISLSALPTAFLPGCVAFLLRCQTGCWELNSAGPPTWTWSRSWSWVWSCVAAFGFVVFGQLPVVLVVLIAVVADCLASC